MTGPTPDPFPHQVLDGLWDDELLRQVLDEFPPPDAAVWRRYGSRWEDKLEGGAMAWGPATRRLLTLLASSEVVDGLLAPTFGIDGLVMETVGGGMHRIPPGGRLAVHTDFNRSPATGRHRRLNLLIYLNEDWDPAWGGQLELWDAHGPARRIDPTWNRTVVFECSERSWHGHPHPLACPPDLARRSVAAYYFTDAPPAGWDGGDHSTLWHEKG